MELLKLDTPVNALLEFKDDQLRASDVILKPPYILFIDGIGKLSKGNISAFKGVAKSKKTFALTMLVAPMVSGSSYDNKIKPATSKKIAWIDTEQSKYDAQKIPKRIKDITGSDDNLLFYALRVYDPPTRVKKIEAILEAYGFDLDLMVIDGIRDLVRDFNDPIESSAIVTLLMKWSAVYDIHISVVLHSNKSNNQMRGHLGTELENKSETVFNIVKDEHLTDASEISEAFGRGRNIEPFKFMINSQGLPELLEDKINLKDIPY